MSTSDNTTSKNSISLKQGIRSIFKNCAAPFKEAYNTYIEENVITTAAITSNAFLGVFITLGAVITKNSEAYFTAPLVAAAGTMIGLCVWGLGQRRAEIKHATDFPVKIYTYSSWKDFHDNKLQEIVERRNRILAYERAQKKIRAGSRQALATGATLNTAMTSLLSYTIL